MARQRNPRVVAVGQLNSMLRRIDWLRCRWGHGRRGFGQVWDDALDGWRKRTPDELPESSVERWREMYATLTDVMLEADDLRLFAQEQIDRLGREAS